MVIVTNTAFALWYIPYILRIPKASKAVAKIQFTNHPSNTPTCFLHYNMNNEYWKVFLYTYKVMLEDDLDSEKQNNKFLKNNKFF